MYRLPAILMAFGMVWSGSALAQEADCQRPITTCYKSCIFDTYGNAAHCVPHCHTLVPCDRVPDGLANGELPESSLAKSELPKSRFPSDRFPESRLLDGL